MKSTATLPARIAISASLFASLATLEKAKGQRKLAEKTEKEIKESFVADAALHVCEEGEDVQWVTETGQLAASLAWQSRASLSRELLLAAGIPEATLAACTVISSFPVLRAH